jgi:hypothetical protein
MQRTHQKLHLQHHRHTGRKLHHRHTSYHGLVVVFVVAGIAMLAVSAMGRAAASSFSIGATVKAAVPATPPLISSPADGSTVASDSQLVAGSCPIITPQVVVTVLLDDTFAGSAVCDADNDFSLPLRLAPGAHTIVAASLTITGDAGPATPATRVTYTPGGTQATGSVTSQPNGVASGENPLYISSDTQMMYLGDDKTATWSGTITGGTAPYQVVLDWGDGKHQTLDQAAGLASLAHTYATLASRNMSVSVIDTKNVALHMQYATASFATTAAPATAAPATTTPGSGSSTSIFGLYGLYLTAVAVFGIVWVEAKHTAREIVHAH